MLRTTYIQDFFQQMAFSWLFITAHTLFYPQTIESGITWIKQNVQVEILNEEITSWLIWQCSRTRDGQQYMYAAISYRCELLSAWSHGIKQLLLLSCSVQFIVAVFIFYYWLPYSAVEHFYENVFHWCGLKVECQRWITKHLNPLPGCPTNLSEFLDTRKNKGVQEG